MAMNNNGAVWAVWIDPPAPLRHRLRVKTDGRYLSVHINISLVK